MPTAPQPRSVPFAKPSVGEAERREVLAVLESGWLTSGPRVRKFEELFAQAVGAPHAVAVNSCTAAMHLAVEALGLKPDEVVLVPTMTFAATAEIVRYMGALPLLVECHPDSLTIDLNDAARKIRALRAGELSAGIPQDAPIVGIIPMHMAGCMADMEAVSRFAKEHGLWVIEDAAHAFPAGIQTQEGFRRCGENLSDVCCFSFYANKTITTGEGGMAVTNNTKLADRMRLMALHGLSRDAWDRYSGGKVWDYRIVAPGFKYNLTDMAAAVGIHQLERAEALRQKREHLALRYLQGLQHPAIALPPNPESRLHAWHLFYIRLGDLSIHRDAFVEELRAAGIGFSVHYRPLHLHPYYQETFGYSAASLPGSTANWERLVSLPLYPDLTEADQDYVIETVLSLVERHAR